MSEEHKKVDYKKATRKKVLDKTGGYCAYCGKRIFDYSFHIDHIIPVCQGGSNELENLIPACIRCNLRKGMYDPDEFKVFLKNQIKNKVHSYINEYILMLAGNYLNKDNAKDLIEAYSNFLDVVGEVDIVFYYERMED